MTLTCFPNFDISNPYVLIWKLINSRSHPPHLYFFSIDIHMEIMNNLDMFGSRVHLDYLRRSLWEVIVSCIEPILLIIYFQLMSFLLVKKNWYSFIPSSSLKLVSFTFSPSLVMFVGTWCSFYDSLDMSLTIPI